MTIHRLTSIGYLAAALAAVIAGGPACGKKAAKEESKPPADGMKPASMEPATPGKDATVVKVPDAAVATKDATGGPPKELLVEVKEAAGAAAPAGDGAANEAPMVGVNAQHTWVAGGKALAAPTQCELVDAKVQFLPATLAAGGVFWINYNGNLRGFGEGKDVDPPAGLIDTPAVGESVVVVTDFKVNVYAFDASTREQKWTFAAGKRVRYAPVISRGAVYLSSDDEHVYALDLATGKEQWKFQAKGPLATPPTVTEGAVFFGDKKGNFFAVDRKTGAEKWTQKLLARFGAPVAAAGTALHLFTQKGWLVAVSAEDGKERWKKYTGYPEEPSLVVTGDLVVVVVGKKKIVAHEAATGKTRWTYGFAKDSPGGLFSALYATGGRVVFLEGDVSRSSNSYTKVPERQAPEPAQVAFATALALDTGKVTWRTDLAPLVAAWVKAEAEKKRGFTDLPPEKQAERLRVPRFTPRFAVQNDQLLIAMAPADYAVCKP